MDEDLDNSVARPVDAGCAEEETRRRRILITGATSGIGRAAAIQAAKGGADIAFCGHEEAGAQETMDAVAAAGGRTYFEVVDLTDLAAGRAFAQRAIAELGGLDGLVNNAGANFWHGVAGAKEEDIRRCFDLNFYAYWAMAQEAYPHLKEAGGGMIVNTASIHAHHTMPGVFPYNVSKAMVVALTTSIALEWGRDNIQCVAIAPGAIHTESMDRYLAAQEDGQALLAGFTNRYPLGRIGRPDDVGSLIAYLLSGENRFISGTTIYVDGGLGAMDPETEYEQ